MEELWKKQLELLQSNLEKEKSVSIINEDVTGVIGSEESPDNLFYSEFPEDDASKMFDIFLELKNNYNINEFAIKIFEQKLREFVDSIGKNYCPIELLLYASRSVKNLVFDDYKINNILVNIVLYYLSSTDSDKVIKYILSGWDWPIQISILLRAIGKKNDRDLVQIATSYYNYLLRNNDNKFLILQSYLKMYISTQDKVNLTLIKDVVTNDYFMKNDDLLSIFTDDCKTNSFMKNEITCGSFLNDLLECNITPQLRTKINYLQSLINKDESFANNMSSSLNEKQKQVEIDKLLFGQNSEKDLHQCENVKGETGCIIVCDTIIKNIENIYPEIARSNAYILLGTKGFYDKDKVINFLLSQKNLYPSYILPINIALLKLESIDVNEAFEPFIKSNYKSFWSRSLGKYFRYNPGLLHDGFIDYIIKNLHTLNELSVNICLHNLNDILKVYNGKSNKLNDKNYPMADRFLSLLNSLGFYFNNSSIYGEILDMVELLLMTCYSSKSDILVYLDNLHNSVKGKVYLNTIDNRIILLIKQGDKLSEPV